MTWKDDFNEEKKVRGVSQPGTIEYERNAVNILKHCPDRPDTRSKMEALSKSSDAETSTVAKKWLSDHSVESEDTHNDSVECDENANDDTDEGCPVCGHTPCIATQGGCCGESRGTDW